MKKVLVCGDLHTKVDILDRVKELSKGYDKVVFLGDYCDDWNAYPQQSTDLLKQLVDWKKHDNRLILLYGNHDLSEWFGAEFTCSGFNPNTHELVSKFLSKNEQYFQVAYSCGDVLFTHAGVTQHWLDDLASLDGQLWTNAETLSIFLNTHFMKRNDSHYSNHVWKALAQAGPGRGGWGAPSPLWADRWELVADPAKGMSQVVGHTPVQTITHSHFKDTVGRENIFCDTHSTTYYGDNIGDKSFLEITFHDDYFTTKVVR